MLVAASTLAPSSAQALDVPALRNHVTDLAGVLAPKDRAAIEHALSTYQRATGHQFALLIVPSLQGEVLEQYSIRVVEAWRLGDETRDDGLLLLVALGDRKVRIEVGHGLEGVITDALSARIIRDVLTPAFRAQNFSGGINRAFALLMDAASGEAVEVPPASPAPGGHEAPPLWLVILFLLIGVPALLILASGRGGRGGGGGFITGGSGGFSSGGFSGGGFSGGGGSFGGGGASGGW